MLVTLVLPAQSGAATVRPGDGVVGGADVAGLSVQQTGRVALRWPSSAPRSVRRAARTGRAQSVLGAGRVVVVSRTVRGSVAAAWRTRPGRRALAAERALAGTRAAVLRAGAARAVWSAGGLTGLVVVGGPGARDLATRLARSVRSRVQALASRTPLQVLDEAVAARGGTPTPAQAAAAFALTVGPVPGFARPSRSSGGIDDGTAAIAWARQTLAGQPATRRAAIQRALAALRPSSGAARRVRAVDFPDWQPDPALQQRGAAAAVQIAARLGQPLLSKLHVGRTPTQYDAGVDAVTYSVDATGGSTGPPADCYVTMYPSFVDENQVFQTEIVTHEVFHCFQAQLLGAAGAPQRKWIIEGGADWVACQIVPNAEPEGALQQWLPTPVKTVVNRSYDAVGLWLLLSSRGVDLWPLWPGVLKAKDPDAQLAAAHEPLVRGAWARSYGAEPARGADWTFGQTPCAQPSQDPAERTPLPVTNTSSAPLKVPKIYAAQLLDLRSAADVVQLHVTRGRADVSSLSPGYDGADVRDIALCTDPQGSCVCPAGSAKAGMPPPPAVDHNGDTVIALLDDTAQSGPMGTVEGKTLEEYCGLHRTQLIVPDRSVGQVYLRQTRRSLLRVIDGWRTGSGGSVAHAQVLFAGGGGGALPFTYEVMLGICNPEIFDDAKELAACRQQFPRSSPDLVGLVQTGSLAFGTAAGIGPGSSADRVMAHYGTAGCVRDRPDDPQSAWSSCDYAGAGGRHTFWGFTGNAGAEVVLAVGVADTAITPARPDASR